MFFTRPTLAPLGIDLREISGGGSCPAQFSGRTADERPIYIRYRGGHFSLHGGDVGAPDHDTPTVLLSARIGPALHGQMLLEQACDLAGLTVRGERLILSDDKRLAAAEEEDIMDWSGGTTYWVRDLAVTEKDGRRFVEALTRAIGEPVFFDATWEQRGGRFCRQYRIFAEYNGGLIGFGADRQRLEALLSRTHATIAEMKAAFAHVLRFSARWKDLPNTNLSYAARFGRPIAFADARLRGRMATEFATADVGGHAFVQTVIEVADAHFPNYFELVDLRTGAIVGTVDYPTIQRGTASISWRGPKRLPTGISISTLTSVTIRRRMSLCGQLCRRK
ncbi:MAG: hypothetical protein K2Y27_00980 [Xanthobacteraceae bacterium]|nr:hypothetical protein [Xanthobacteraceae bacterium]